MNFPLTGYHKDIPTTNDHSIFELVEVNKMYEQGTPPILESKVRLDILKELKNFVPLSDEDIAKFTEDSSPFGWMGVATKSDGLEYQGSFVKRVINWAWKTYQVRLPQEFTCNLGSMVGKLVGGEDKMYLRFDPFANYERGQFGDAESCFWGVRKKARVLIRNEGGCFVEFFDNPDAEIEKGHVVNGMGLSRGWIVPVNQFIGSKEFAFIISNFYTKNEEKMNSFNMTRAVANVLGMSYKKVEVTSGMDVFYVNGNKSFLLSSVPKILNNTSTLRFNYSREYSSDAGTDPELNWFVVMEVCDDCGAMYDSREMNHIRFSSGIVKTLCSTCSSHYKSCANCGTNFAVVKDTLMFDGDYYCSENCAHHRGYDKCNHCNKWFNLNREDGRLYTLTNTSRDRLKEEDRKLCRDCIQKIAFRCADCGKWEYKNRTKDPAYLRDTEHYEMKIQRDKEREKYLADRISTIRYSTMSPQTAMNEYTQIMDITELMELKNDNH